MNARLLSKHDKFPFETETLYSYKMQTSGNPNALAKGYDKENILTIVLKVAKSSYQNEEIQRIIKWSREPYNSPNYYRDLAINLKTKGDFEKTIVFTHAKVKADVYSDTHLDELTITLTATQKEDKMPGVAFGRELEETYEKAWDRVNNPPRLNIYIPPVAGFEKKEEREYAGGPYKGEFVTYHPNGDKTTVTLDSEAGFKYFYDADNKRNPEYEYLTQGFRPLPSVGYRKTYTRHIGVISIVKDGGKKNGGDEWTAVSYIENGVSYAIVPKFLFEKLDYSILTPIKNGEYSLQNNSDSSKKATIHWHKYNNVALTNVSLPLVAEKLSNQINTTIGWDGKTKTTTISFGKSVNLHIIKTHANNITFKDRNGEHGIPESEYGINGGYFNLSAARGEIGPLNICVKDDTYLKPNQETNNGKYNCHDYGLKGSGTLIYTGTQMKCEVARDYRSDIANMQYGAENVNCKWAQGGCSMSLGNSGWAQITRNESLNQNTDYRTGMLADTDCNVYLIVSDVKVSPAEFREAIQKEFGIQDGRSTKYMGIFLDGSTCSQFRCKEKSIFYTRGLLPLIVLINK